VTGPLAALLADGKRLHLQHGPIDLIVEADGSAEIVGRAYAQAAARFETVLDELVGELPLLRSRATTEGLGLRGPVARRMEAAVAPHASRVFITPMAAVAGAVADEVLAAMTDGLDLDRAYVNNGGDIALHLSGDSRFEIGLVAVPDRPELSGRATIRADDCVRGIATSGRHGRSLSLGIADAVTVLARTAAEADAAATLIANAVDLPGHPAIRRVPASERAPDSDLGNRLVTEDVGSLADAEIAAALEAGEATTRAMIDRGVVIAAVLQLRGAIRQAGDLAIAAQPDTPIFAPTQRKQPEETLRA